MNNNIIVRSVIGSDIGGYSRVTISNELFNDVRGVKPALPYQGRGDIGGHGVRVFNIGGVDLYVNYDKTNRKTVFIMKTSDAQRHLLPLATERANEPKLPFNAAMFITA